MTALSFPKDLGEFVIVSGVHPMGSGQQMVLRFPNGYGASVVRTEYSYGGAEGFFELAVIRFDGDDFALCYDTPITNGVIGWLDRDAVVNILYQIMTL